MIIEDIHIAPYDDKRWVIQTAGNHNLLVSKGVVDLINIFKQSLAPEDAMTAFNAKFNTQFTVAEFEAFVYTQLSGYGLLKGQQSNARKFSYLKLRFQLLPPSWVTVFSIPFRFFFIPTFFWLAFTSLLILSTIIVISHLDVIAYADNVNFLLIGSIILSSAFFHELGHTAACCQYRVKHGGIGFGFYWIIPVFYAEITNIWLVGKQKRIIANLAGIFNEVLLTATLLLLWQFIPRVEFIVCASILLVKALSQLNPFFRMDGYWILSDLTNTPNLSAKSKQAVKALIEKIKNANKRWEGVSFREVMLIAYGIFNFMLVLGYCGYILLIHHQQIYSFPSELLAIGSKLFTWNLHVSDFSETFLLLLAFYLMILRISVRKITALTITRFKRVGLMISKEHLKP